MHSFPTGERQKALEIVAYEAAEVAKLFSDHKNPRITVELDEHLHHTVTHVVGVDARSVKALKQALKELRNIQD